LHICSKSKIRVRLVKSKQPETCPILRQSTNAWRCVTGTVQHRGIISRSFAGRPKNVQSKCLYCAVVWWFIAY